MFKIEVNEDRKVLQATVWGCYTQEVALAFLQTFNKAAVGIEPKDYSLIIDSTDLEVSTRELVPVLTEILKVYMQYPFKKRINVNMTSPEALAQAKEVACQAGTDFIFVPSLEEAYALIN